jgi:hypothetical protein
VTYSDIPRLLSMALVWLVPDRRIEKALAASGHEG